jgi:hypothetical protein
MLTSPVVFRDSVSLRADIPKDCRIFVRGTTPEMWRLVKLLPTLGVRIDSLDSTACGKYGSPNAF